MSFTEVVAARGDLNTLDQLTAATTSKRSRGWNKLNLVGQRFGRWVVLAEGGRTPRGQVRWRCRCDCGVEKDVDGGSLRNGKSTSCGCYRSEICQKCGQWDRGIPLGTSAKKFRFNAYRCGAKKRGLVFEISFDDFVRLIEQPCHYCGRVWSCKVILPLDYTDRSPYLCNGIDRIDNSLGYTTDNCIPCCRFCNTAKHDRTQQEFIADCVAVAEKANVAWEPDWL
jgi:hypothetical protein